MMIEVKNLTKSYRSRLKQKLVVHDLSFRVEEGKVTGFLGPNGAGKSTSMRLMLGLDRGRGSTTYDGKSLRKYKNPSQVVGILLEAKAFHPTRTARNHLKILASAGGIPASRVDEVIDMVGLSEVARKGPGKFSLGMSQRLGIAAAILGKPKYLLLDEPANGLDPEGIAWLRQFIREYAKADNGILVSSHLLSEMSQMADNVVVIGKGRLIVNTSIKDLLAKGIGSYVIVRVDKLHVMQKILADSKLDFQKIGNTIHIQGVTTDSVGKLARKANITLLELSKHTGSLEEAFLDLTEGSQEFQAKTEKGRKKDK